MTAKLLQYLLAAALGVGGYFAIMALGGDAQATLETEGYVVESPVFLWALALIPLLIVVRIHTLSDLPKVQQGLSILIKAAFIAAVTASLVDVQKVDKQPKKAAVVYVVDVSESVPDAMLTRAREAVESTWRDADENEVRLVVFAGEAREVTLPPRLTTDAEASDGEDSDEVAEAVSFPVIPRLPETRLSQKSDVQGALRFAFALLSDGYLPRIVLVTDGLETTGNLEAELATARRFGIPIHYRDYNDVPRPGELMVTEVVVPENLKANIPFVATASVRTTARTAARCELLLDGVLAEGKEFTFDLGDTKVALEGKFKAGGDKKVAVVCTPSEVGGVAADDRFASNNRFEIPVKVPRKPKVLYVEGDRRHSRNLSVALSRDFDLEVRGARGVPSAFTDANQFDLIFISDVPRVGEMNYQNMTTAQMTVLERYARSGGGLIFAGGENSYGPGGYTSTHLERKVLPVRLDVTKKQDIPGVALMLVIDRSGSMTGEKIELAKEAATATLGVLNPNDMLGIIAFDSRPSQIVKLQRASNHLRIKNAVSRLRPGGGTDIFQALDQAFAELRRTRAKVKHIILLTDGQSNRSGIIDLGTQASEHRITVSTVAVGLQTDHQLLSRLAEVAGGNSYRTTSAKNVPKLFVKEASEVTRKALVEEQFRPRVPARFRNLQMFKGLNMGAAPALIGYVSTRAKSRAEVLMVSHTGEPVLARWRLGLGKVLAWTSDVKSRWSYYWLKWGGYAKFWRQVIRDSMRVEKDDPTYQMVAEVVGGELTVGVDAVDADDRFIDGVASDVTVTGPDGEDQTLTLTQTAAGRYEAKLPLSVFGPYTIRGTHIRAETADTEEEVHTSFAQVAWPFPQEHLVGLPDLAAVARVASATGGTRDPENTVLFDVAGAETEKRTPMWPYPLYLAMALLLLDILLRRIRFYGKTRITWSEVSG